MSSDARVTDLEIRLTHQQQVIATLDEVVREFAARVEHLERQLDELRRTHPAAAPGGRSDGDGGDGGGGGDDPPPHY